MTWLRKSKRSTFSVYFSFNSSPAFEFILVWSNRKPRENQNWKKERFNWLSNRIVWRGTVTIFSMILGMTNDGQDGNRLQFLKKRSNLPISGMGRPQENRIFRFFKIHKNSLFIQIENFFRSSLHEILDLHCNLPFSEWSLVRSSASLLKFPSVLPTASSSFEKKYGSSLTAHLWRWFSSSRVWRTLGTFLGVTQLLMSSSVTGPTGPGLLGAGCCGGTFEMTGLTGCRTVA